MRTTRPALPIPTWSLAVTALLVGVMLGAGLLHGHDVSRGALETAGVKEGIEACSPPPDEVESHACRLWGLVGADYPSDLILDHLRDGEIENLRHLAMSNRDGWGFTSFPEDSPLPLSGPIVRRGRPAADHPTDPDYNRAVEELHALRPRAVLGHIRNGSSGHWGLPNPHPFEHERKVFAHNGSIQTEVLYWLLVHDTPGYLNYYPPDYVNGHIDSELYFMVLLKTARKNPGGPFHEALLQGIRDIAGLLSTERRMNFVLTDGDTLWALRFAPYDEGDPLRYCRDGGGVPEPSPWYAVASQVLGSTYVGWTVIPPRTLAVFVPNEMPAFFGVDPIPAALPGVDAASGSPAAGILSARPNPSSGRVALLLRIPPGGAHISLEVWDAGGRRVSSAEPRWCDAGEHALAWDALDGMGRPVPSGNYFCRVRIGEEVLVQRVAVVR